jgi:predicted nicotinamide N-methyase
MLDLLSQHLQSRIPGAILSWQCPPQTPDLPLLLIREDYPREGLPYEVAQALMDNPPYWCFCWASGQVLARYVLEHPEIVKDQTVIDFGAGCGIVAIASALAGAERVVACDLDPNALAACEFNAQRNGVNLEYSNDVFDLLADINMASAIITVADVFYDRDNLPLLDKFNAFFKQVLVADSRLKGVPLPGLRILGVEASHTVPDLDESVEFNRVTLYRTVEP